MLTPIYFKYDVNNNKVYMLHLLALKGKYMPLSMGMMWHLKEIPVIIVYG